MAFCQVIVDIASEDVDRVFTYRVPKGMALCPGMRVHVPFGRKPRIEGVVVDMADSCDLPPERVKEVADTLEDYPAVMPALLELAKEDLPNGQREWFYDTVIPLARENLVRVKEDLDHFVSMFDYRSAGKDWKNSRDAVSRSMQKLRGLYPADPPFKMDT